MKPPFLHRLLLLAYPRAARRRRGRELSEFWRLQGEEPRYRGPGRILLILALVADAIRGGARERWAGEGRERPRAVRDSRVRAAGYELRRAAGTLRRAPGFTLVAILTLSLGIGATTAVVAIVEQVLLRPLEYARPDRLVLLTRADDETTSVSWPDFRDWRASARGFDGMAAWTETSADFQETVGAVTRLGVRTTANLFDVLGVPPLLGRTFLAEEDRPGGPDAVIVSWGVWQDQLGADADVLSRTIRIDGRPVPVVGVMPRGFAFPDPSVDFWVPLREDQVLVDAGLPAGSRTLGFLNVLARLRADGPPAAALADLRVVVARIDAENLPADRPRRPVRMEPLLEHVVGDVRSTLFMLLGAVGLVLVVACANAAGLAISRLAVRRREMAVRTALGAGRLRLLTHLLAEGAVLTGAAGVVGLAVGWATLRAIIAVAPADVPRLATPGPGLSALLAWAGITALSGLLFALVPAVRGSRIGAPAGLASTRGASSSRHELRPQHALVVLQVALSVILLSGAVLLARSYQHLRQVDPGFTRDGILTAWIAPPERRYAGQPERVEAFWTELLGRLRARPDVQAATSTYSAPLSGQEFRTSVVREHAEEDEPVWAGSVVIRDDFFATTGVRLIAGRDFGAQDVHGAPAVAIVSETMARKLWPGEDPIGRRFRFAGGIVGAIYSFDREYFAGWLTVVGVAGDVRRTRLEADPEPEFYRPHAQLPWPPHTLIVRTASDPTALAGPIRDLVHDIDPETPVENVRTVRSSVRTALAPARFRTLLLTAFGGITCLLAMVGLHAVMSLAVARRTRELGIRIALGATRRALTTRVLRSGLGLVAAGTAIGLVVALLATRALSAFLYGVARADAVTWAAVIAITAIVALAACIRPARRAGRIDPIRSIQAD